ncbi:hypothetical protein AB0C84_42805 [Actinomadura sp. NPDC048955]|uniref:hypothetical protein n=1 Tax=Actinomadura sp. NPDC048955 TaxID=3158228 RepID=UPI0033D31F07
MLIGAAKCARRTNRRSQAAQNATGFVPVLSSFSVRHSMTLNDRCHDNSQRKFIYMALLISLTAPSAGDVDAQAPNLLQPPILFIGGVQISLECDSLEEAARSAEFLERLVEVGQRQQRLLGERLETLRDEKALHQPDADPARFEEALARQLDEEEPPRFIIFSHEDNTRSVWQWGQNFVTHYDDRGREGPSALVNPATIVEAAIRASAFGAIRSHRGSAQAA